MNIEKQFQKIQEREEAKPFTSSEEFSNALEQSFNATKNEQEPMVHLDLYLGAHRSPEDLDAMLPLFERCDVYIPEILGYPAELQEEYQDVSNGKGPAEEITARHLKEAMFSKFHTAELGMIQDSGKVILFIDLPMGHPLIEELKKTIPLLGKIPPAGHSYEEALTDLKNLYAEFGRQQQEREHYIRDNFKVKLFAALQDRPDLLKKESLNILMRMGMAHTSLSKDFKNADLHTNRTFQDLPIVFAAEHQLLRSVLFNKEMDNDLLIHALLTTLINKAAPQLFSSQVSKDTIGMFAYLQKVQKGFTADEVRELWDAMRTSDFEPTVLLEKLQEKNIPIPKTIEELRAI